MFTSETQQSDTKSIVKQFAKFCQHQLSMPRLPRIRMVKDADWSAKNGTFGHYDHDSKTLTISVAGRHIMDVLRTMAHELVHAHQDKVHGLPATAGKTGSPYENEANAVAGRIMRRWAQQHGDMFDNPMDEDRHPNVDEEDQPAATNTDTANNQSAAVKEPINTADVLRGVQTVGRTYKSLKDLKKGDAEEEIVNRIRAQLRDKMMREASGYIPTKKQARDPRFSMALTTDIKPGQLGKEANKLNLDTDSQGHPALLMKKLNNLLESVKTGQDPELLDEDELFELNMSPTNLKKMAAETGAIAGIEFEMYVPNAADDEEDE